MSFKTILASIIVLLSLSGPLNAGQICEGDSVTLAFMGGRLGKVAISYYRSGKVTFGPDGGGVSESKHLDQKTAGKYWSLAENVAGNVTPGKYGVIENIGKRETDVRIRMCDRTYSYVAVIKSKDPNYSQDLANLLKYRP